MREGNSSHTMLKFELQRAIFLFVEHLGTDHAMFKIALLHIDLCVYRAIVSGNCIGRRFQLRYQCYVARYTSKLHRPWIRKADSHREIFLPPRAIFLAGTWGSRPPFQHPVPAPHWIQSLAFFHCTLLLKRFLPSLLLATVFHFHSDV